MQNIRGGDSQQESQQDSQSGNQPPAQPGNHAPTQPGNQPPNQPLVELQAKVCKCKAIFYDEKYKKCQICREKSKVRSKRYRYFSYFLFLSLSSNIYNQRKEKESY